MTSCTDSWVRLDQILSAHPVDATTWILDRIYRADWDREGTDMENPGNLCEIARSFGDASARSKEKLLLHLLDGFGQLPVECREKIVVTLVPAIVALYLALTKVKETSPLILAWVELFSHTNFNELDIAILQKLARALERELRKLPMAVFVYALGCMSSSERKALLLSLRGAKPIDVPQRVLLCQILESKYCHKYARQLVLMLKQFSFSALATFAVLLFFEFYLASRFTGCGETLAAWLMMDAFLWSCSLDDRGDKDIRCRHRQLLEPPQWRLFEGSALVPMYLLFRTSALFGDNRYSCDRCSNRRSRCDGDVHRQLF